MNVRPQQPGAVLRSPNHRSRVEAIRRHRAGMKVVVLAIAILVTMLHPSDGRAQITAAPGAPFEPIALQRIALPAALTEASDPVFTLDGRHLLFFSGGHLWIIGSDGQGLRCLSCGLANEPMVAQTEQEGFATEFPDRRRVFFGAGTLGVLECSPSVIDCVKRQILQIDESGARPDNGIVPPGGVDLGAMVDQGGGSSPKLAPDGQHVVFSDVRLDMAELMVMTTLERTDTKYVLTNPRVLNPPSPTSLSDPRTVRWSDGSALYEFKSFANGGADGTYVEVGGAATSNPDVWEVDFRTGQRTRLTSHPDWDEDNAPSPDGRSIVIESDRTMHRVDMLGSLLPVRGFIDSPIIAAEASYYVAGPIDRQCDLQPWLLPAHGDRDAQLLGQPIEPYTGGDVHAANNVTGYPQWNPNGTEIALNTESYTTNRSAPYLLIAHLVARKPTKPLPVVNSTPGSWAPGPLDYHGVIGATTQVVLHGLASGTATVTYANPDGLISGMDTVTYHDYSDNGYDIVNGTTEINNVNILTGPITLKSQLTLSGRDSGYSRIDVQFSGIQKIPEKVSGTAVDNYDGTTISGPPAVPQPCPKALPRPPRTALTVTTTHRADHLVLRVHVTATIDGAGLNEAQTDTRPVIDALIKAAGRSTHTNARGYATLTLPNPAPTKIRVTETAGDTLRGTSRVIHARNASRRSAA